MRYRCKACGREFDLPASITYPSTYTVPVNPSQHPVVEINWPSTVQPPKTFTYTYTVSVPCCPHCYSTDIEEAKE